MGSQWRGRWCFWGGGLRLGPDRLACPSQMFEWMLAERTGDKRWGCGGEYLRVRKSLGKAPAGFSAETPGPRKSVVCPGYLLSQSRARVHVSNREKVEIRKRGRMLTLRSGTRRWACLRSTLLLSLLQRW